MTSTIQEKINKARDIRHSDMKVFMGSLMNYARTERIRIDSDGMLSGEGKAYKQKQLSDKLEVAFFSQVRESQNEYRQLLSEAKAEAQSLLLAEPKKVDTKKQRLFDRELSALKANVLFGLTSQQRVDAMSEIVSKADERGLALQIDSEFMKLAENVINASGSPEDKESVRYGLRVIHERLQKQQDVPEAEQIRKAFNAITDLEKAPVVNRGLFDSQLKEIGKRTLDFADSIDEYHEKHADFIAEVSASVE